MLPKYAICDKEESSDIWKSRHFILQGRQEVCWIYVLQGFVKYICNIWLRFRNWLQSCTKLIILSGYNQFEFRTKLSRFLFSGKKHITEAWIQVCACLTFKERTTTPYLLALAKAQIGNWHKIGTQKVIPNVVILSHLSCKDNLMLQAFQAARY